MDEKKIARINELAKKAKSEEGLTPEEMVEADTWPWPLAVMAATSMV